MTDEDAARVALQAGVDDAVDDTLRERVPVLHAELEDVVLLEMDGDDDSERDVDRAAVGELVVDVLGHLETVTERDNDDESLFDPDDDADAETDRDAVGDGVSDMEGDGEVVVDAHAEVEGLGETEPVLLRVADSRGELDGVAHDDVDGVKEALSELETVDELERHAVADAVDECDSVRVLAADGETDREIVGVALIVRETDAVKVVDTQDVDDALRLGDAVVDEQPVPDGDGETDVDVLGDGELLGLPDSCVDGDGLGEVVVESLGDADADAHPENEDVPEDDGESDGDTDVDALLVSVVDTVVVGDDVTDGVKDLLLSADGELLPDCERDCVPVFERVAVPHDDGETVDVLERHAVADTERDTHAVDESVAHADDDADTETVVLTEGEPVSVPLPELDGETLPLLVTELDCDADGVPDTVADAHADADGDVDADGDADGRLDAESVRVTDAHADAECDTVAHEVTLLLTVELALMDEHGDAAPLADTVAVCELLTHDVGLSVDENERTVAVCGGDGEYVADTDGDPVSVRDCVLTALDVEDTVAQRDTVGEAHAVIDTDGELENDALPERVVETDTDDDADDDPVIETDAEGDRVAPASDTLATPDTDGEGVEDTLMVDELETVTDADTPEDADAKGDTDCEPDVDPHTVVVALVRAEAETVIEALEHGVALREIVPLDDVETLGETGALADMTEALAVSVPFAGAIDPVREPLTDGDAEMVPLREPDGVTEGESDAVVDTDGDGELAGDRDNEGVCVTVAEPD